MPSALSSTGVAACGGSLARRSQVWAASVDRKNCTLSSETLGFQRRYTVSLLPKSGEITTLPVPYPFGARPAFAACHVSPPSVERNTPPWPDQPNRVWSLANSGEKAMEDMSVKLWSHVSPPSRERWTPSCRTNRVRSCA